MSSQFVVVVIGEPETQGSKTQGTNSKTGRRFIREDNPRVKKWRDKVIAAARTEYQLQRRSIFGPIDGPVDVDLHFRISRSNSHYGTGRNAKQLRPSAPGYPASARGTDIDKLARACLDALTQAKVITDDVRVVDLHAFKRYAEPPERPGVTLVVRPHYDEIQIALGGQPVETVAVQGALL